MAKRVSTAQAKSQFSALVAEVAFGGQQIIIERHGKPLAALISMDDLTRLQEGRPTSAEPRGALALLGAWADVDEQELDALVEEIYASRLRETGRPVILEP